LRFFSLGARDEKKKKKKKKTRRVATKTEIATESISNIKSSKGELKAELRNCETHSHSFVFCFHAGDENDDCSCVARIGRRLVATCASGML
jgi:hypothetical protein